MEDLLLLLVVGNRTDRAGAYQQKPSVIDKLGTTKILYNQTR